MEYAGAEITNSDEDNAGINIKVSESHPELSFLSAEFSCVITDA